MERECKLCGRTFEIIKRGHTRIYCFECSPTGSMSDKKVQQDSMNTKRRSIKKHLIDRMGGSCGKCGYNSCIDALEFHHLDPSQKDFGIGKTFRKLESYYAELEKCILVCANCHREIHYAEYTQV